MTDTPLFEACFSSGLGNLLQPIRRHKHYLTYISSVCLLQDADLRLKEESVSEKTNEKILKFSKNLGLLVTFETPDNTSKPMVYDLRVVNKSELGSSPIYKPVQLSNNNSENFISVGMVQGTPAFLEYRDQPIDTLDDEQPLYNVDIKHDTINKTPLKQQKNDRLLCYFSISLDGTSYKIYGTSRRQFTTINYLPTIDGTYPSFLGQKASFSIPVIFPEGVGISKSPNETKLISSYVGKSEDSLEKTIITYVKYSEPADDDLIQKINLLFGTKISHKNIFVDKVIAILADNNQIDAHKSALDQIKNRFIHEPKVIPSESLFVKNIIKNFKFSLNKKKIFQFSDKFSEGEISVQSSQGIPNICQSSIKTLFRHLSIASIVKIFKNIILERGIFFVGKSRTVAFDIFESLISFIYPLVWDFPKIVSLEVTHSFFDSPIPLMYFIRTLDFQQRKIDFTSLDEKCLVFLDIDEVKEYSSDSIDLPYKVEDQLSKRLSKSVGEYNKFYLKLKNSDLHFR